MRSILDAGMIATSYTDAPVALPNLMQVASIKAGKLADFVVLSADPVAIDPKLINTIKVMETIKEGRAVFVGGAR
jgi:imidazolonepropionase-like amidohydrolase